MRLSCLPVSLYPDLAAGRLTPGGWFRMAAGLGLNGADLSVAHVTSREPAYLDALRAEAADAGVVIPMLASYTDFTHPDAGERARQVDDLRRWVDAAVRLGTPMIRVTAGQAHPGVGEAEGLDWAVAGLKACLAEAESAGVRLLYENHVRGAVWSHNDFTQPVTRYLDVVKRTEGASLALLFDTANNLALDVDPLEVFEAVVARIGAIHVSDFRERGVFSPCPIGTGVAPIAAIFQKAVSAGFDDWLSIEEASRTGPDAFAPSVAFVDRAWGDAGGAPRTPHPAPRSSSTPTLS